MSLDTEEVERLTAEVERLRKGLDQKNIHEAALNNTIERLRARNERLLTVVKDERNAAEDAETEVVRLREEKRLWQNHDIALQFRLHRIEEDVNAIADELDSTGDGPSYAESLRAALDKEVD